MLSSWQSWLDKQRKTCNNLPRRLFGNFRSERNTNEKVEQAFLKQLLKEHGLYYKHQTIQQRRVLKYLLESEQRTAQMLAEERADVSIVANDTGLRTCLIELHSLPFSAHNASPQLRSVASPKLRRFSLQFGGNLDEVTVSLPTTPQKAKDTAKLKSRTTISWDASGSRPFLETAV